MKVQRVAIFLLACAVFAGFAAAGELHADVLQCSPSSPQMFKFLGNNIVNLQEGTVAKFENWCFEENQVFFEWKSKTEIHVHLESAGKRHLLCTEDLMISTLLHTKLETKFFSGKTTHVIKLKDESEQHYVRTNGISVIPLCDKLKNIIPDVIKTVAIFDDQIFSNFPPWFVKKMMNENFERLEKLTGVQSKKRNLKVPITYDWLMNHVKSGDIYCQYSPSGGSTVILFGTGGVCSHVGMFLWEGDHLYFVESNPPDIHRYDAQYYFAKIRSDPENELYLLQLSDESRNRFDVDAAWKTYNNLKGKPYGFDNILFSFWDTPESSFTQLANTEILFSYVALLNKIPKAKPYVTQFIEQGLNRRLGTQGLNFNQIVDTLGQRGMKIGDLGAITENPNWTYGSDNGPRYICSALVAKLLLDGGVFAGFDISPQEFTPNDIYNLNIFKTKGIPAECQMNDPYLPYCQLNGNRSLLPFKYYNSIMLYSHMNEKCPALAPLYVRPDKC